MSTSQRAASRRSPCELETVTHWPTVFAVGGLTVVFLVVPLVASVALQPPRIELRPIVAKVAHAPKPVVRADEEADEPPTSARVPAPVPVEIVAYHEAPTPPSFDVPAPAPERANIVATAAPPAKLVPPTPAQTATGLKGRIVADYACFHKGAWHYGLAPEDVEEEALQQYLQASALELDLGTEKNTQYRLFESARASSTAGPAKDSQPAQAVLLDLLEQRPDLQGLPLRLGNACRTESGVAKCMSDISTTLRRAAARRTPSSSGSFSDSMSQRPQVVQLLESKSEWQRDEAIPALVQMLQVEPAYVRQALVKTLARIPGARASQALAHRAIFDLSPEVRAAAIKSLGERPGGEFRQELLAAFRYPWPIAAEQAAEAVVKLKQTDLIPALVDLLDRPDPQAPFQDEKQEWAVRELVKVNHFRNCLLCHAPSIDRQDALRGLIPTPGQRITEAYYESSSGQFVQATVTYIKQDFSAMHDVPNSGPWPGRQRHDYFVRTRKLDATSFNVPVARADYPQREAVITALRHLTREDLGNEAKMWHEYLRREWVGVE